MILKKKIKENIFTFNLSIFKNKFSKSIIVSLIVFQFLIIILFSILLVPRQNFFYAINTNYSDQSGYMRLIKSFEYISTSLFSAFKLKFGLVKTDLNIEIKDSDLSRLMFLKSQAYEDSSRNYVDKKYKVYFNASFQTEKSKFNGEIRLKGDGKNQHFGPTQWSLRVRLKDNEFLGMKSFNLQHPQRRSFLSSYILHLFTKYENIPTKKFGLITVSVNGKEMGLYNYEEIPSKDMYKRIYGKSYIPIFFNDDYAIEEDNNNFCF